MAYRLNILGFFTDNKEVASGNWGLLDQAAALDWVQRNIDSFGGSAQNVTVFGQGSGAVSVGLHMVSPGSRDRFQRAIGMSGNALLRKAITSGTPDAVFELLENEFGCFRISITGCLRNIKAETLVKFSGSLTHWGPVIDGPALINDSRGREPFLPDTPAVLLEEGRFVTVPYMIGYNRMEDAFTAFDKADGGVEGITMGRFEALVRDDLMDDDDWRSQQQQQILQQQQQQQQLMAVAEDSISEGIDGGSGGGGSDGMVGVVNCTLNADFVVDTIALRYARQMDDPETLRRNYAIMLANKVYGATAYRVVGHVSRYNVTYVYRYDYKLRATKAVPAVTDWMDAPHGTELPMMWGMPYWPSAGIVDWTAIDRRMSDTMMALWTNFARYADPGYRMSLGNNVRWEEFQSHSPRSMVLDKVPNMSLPDQEPEFWNDYYPKVLAVSLQCCSNYTVKSAAGPAARSGWLILLLLLSCVSCFSFSYT